MSDLIRRAREALVDVTPGPWFPNYPDYHAGMVEVVGPAMRCVGFTIATDVDAEKAQRIKADASFVAAARDLVPAMADRLEAQEALLREAMEALERCPPTSNPTLTAEYNLERIEAWWRLEVRPVLAKLRQHLEGSHRAEK